MGHTKVFLTHKLHVPCVQSSIRPFSDVCIPLSFCHHFHKGTTMAFLDNVAFGKWVSSKRRELALRGANFVQKELALLEKGGNNVMTQLLLLKVYTSTLKFLLLPCLSVYLSQDNTIPMGYGVSYNSLTRIPMNKPRRDTDTSTTGSRRLSAYRKSCTYFLILMGILLLLTATIPVLLHLFLGKGLSLTFHFTMIDYCRNEFYFCGIYRCLNVGYIVNLKNAAKKIVPSLLIH